MGDPFAQEKVYEALAYFSRNVKYAGKLKLFKLLYYLDLLVFRRTGNTVTGLRYEAWPFGPVPASLDQEFGNPESELHRRFSVERHQRIESEFEVTIDTDPEKLEAYQHTVRHIPGSIRPRAPYRHRFLTRREQLVAEYLAEVFREAKADEMTDISHNKFGPWKKAISRGNKVGSQSASN
ncbi:MAG: SocA family protein [Nevskiaceae bacterium]|jgi:uncharacterized phage-associated protein|nr:SocA family protein [Nevskiaceae bacterium]